MTERKPAYWPLSWIFGAFATLFLVAACDDAETGGQATAPDAAEEQAAEQPQTEQPAAEGTTSQ